MKDATKGMMLPPPVLATSVKQQSLRVTPNHLLDLVTRLCLFKAERWGRRALFYEKHRDYFPRLSAGRFVSRCRALEARYRALAQLIFLIPADERLVPVHALGFRRS
ncbi:MAG: hypothetical protein JNL29_16370 [Nitrospira sp.]|nr:hypothetical protein [Nitrospira sp.]